MGSPGESLNLVHLIEQERYLVGQVFDFLIALVLFLKMLLTLQLSLPSYLEET
jgi:hypothetical protein